MPSVRPRKSDLAELSSVVNWPMPLVLSAPRPSAPGRAEDRIVAVHEAAAMNALGVGEGGGDLQGVGQRLLHGERPGVGARIGEVLVGDVHLRMIGRQVAGVGNQLVVSRRREAEAVEGGVAIDRLAHRTVGGAGARQVQARRARVVDAAAQTDQRLAFLAGGPDDARAAAGTASSTRESCRWRGSPACR